MTKRHSTMRMMFVAVFASVLIFMQALTTSAATFPDVPSNHQFYKAIEEASSKGYINGFDDGLFRPDQTLERVQGAIVFSNVLKSDTTGLDKQYFTDVPQSYKYYKQVSSIARQGIIGGYPDGSFGLYDDLSRGQVALAIYRTFDFSEFDTKNVPFTDVKGTRYEAAVAALYNAGVTSGTSATTFGTDLTITRGQFIALLTNAQAAIHKDKSIKEVNVTVNDNQTATVNGYINNFKLDGTELVNIKVVSKNNNQQVINVDVKPNNKQYFTYTTNTLVTGDYVVNVSIVGSENKITKEFTIVDKITPGAPGISFVGKSVVGGVVDLLDLQTDLNTRFTYGTEGLTGAQIGDTLKYKVYSDDAVILDKSVVLTEANINQGYVQETIKTNALRNLLGGLLDLDGLLSTASISDVEAAALKQAIEEDPEVEAAILGGVVNGLLGKDGLVGGLLGGSTDGNLVGGVVDGVLGGSTDGNLVGGVVDGVLGGSTDGNLLGGVVNGVVGLVDGLLGVVVNGELVGGLLDGAAEVTIEVQLIDKAGNASAVTKEVYKFQVTDVVGL